MAGRRTETLAGTLAFAAAVGFGCALLVSAAVYWLRPMQQATQANDHSRAIVAAAGWHGDVTRMSDLEIVNAYDDFEERIAMLRVASGQASAGEIEFDFSGEPAEAESGEAQPVPYYLLYEEGRLVRAVLPFHGPGMWSVIHGLLVLEGDLTTIAALVILQHGETPGIGDRIENPAWLEGWRGKRLYGPGGSVRLQVRARPRPEELPFAIDAISGATVTVNALEEAVARWFGADGYAPVLEALREAGS